MENFFIEHKNFCMLWTNDTAFSFSIINQGIVPKGLSDRDFAYDVLGKKDYCPILTVYYLAKPARYVYLLLMKMPI